MNYQVIALDLDGTLLTPEKQFYQPHYLPYRMPVNPGQRLLSLPDGTL